MASCCGCLVLILGLLMQVHSGVSQQCSESWRCSQLCRVNNGDDECYCADGYSPDQQDSTKCRADNQQEHYLLYSRFQNRFRHGVTRYNFTIDSTEILWSFRAGRMDYDLKTQSVIAVHEAENGEKAAIKRRRCLVDDETATPETLWPAADSKVSGLAYDWIHDTVYWIISQGNQTGIHAFNVESDYHEWLYDLTPPPEDSDDIFIGLPSTIVVDPRWEQRWIYWGIREGESNIMKAGLDGSERHDIVKGGSSVNVLTLDIAANRIFWMDESNGHMMSANLEGFNSHIHFSSSSAYSVDGTIAMSIFEEWVYVINGYLTDGIYKIDKLKGEASEVISDSSSTTNIKMVHPSLQRAEQNVCRHVLCSHGCLPGPYKLSDGGRTARCLCPTNWTLDSDGITCNEVMHGGWSSWGSYLDCSVLCGGGESTRVRSCTNPSPAYGGDNCVGHSTQSVPCNTHICIVTHGGWSSWGSYSDCSVLCDGGESARDRSCTNPSPAYGGDDCVGDSTQIIPCNTHICPASEDDDDDDGKKAAIIAGVLIGVFLLLLILLCCLVVFFCPGCLGKCLDRKRKKKKVPTATLR